MIKPVGSQILVKIKKKRSKIELLPDASFSGDDAIQAVVEELGTTCTMGLEVGNSVMFKAGTSPVVVSQEEEFDLIIVPEVSVLYITNYDKPKNED